MYSFPFQTVMADDDLNEVISDLESAFDIKIEDDECEALFSPFNLGAKLSTTEARYCQSMARSDKQEVFTQALANIRNDPEVLNADKIIYAVLQARKEKMLPSSRDLRYVATRNGRDHERGPLGRSERAMSSPPPLTFSEVDPMSQTNTPSTTVGYQPHQRTPLSPLFDRRSASRTRMNRSTSKGSVATPGPTPPIQRRVPRPGERRHNTEILGGDGYSAYSPYSVNTTNSAASSAAKSRHLSSVTYSDNGNFKVPPPRLLDLEDDTMNQVEGVKPRSNNWIQQRRVNRPPARTEYSAVNPLFGGAEKEKRQPMVEPQTRFVEAVKANRNGQNVISVDLLLSQLFPAIRGVGGMYFRKDSNGQLHVCKTAAVDFDTQSRMEYLLMLGNVFNYLPVDSCSDNEESMDLFSRAFQPAVYQLRMEYLQEVDRLEEKCRHLSTDLTIIQLILFKGEWLPQLTTLAQLWLGLKNRPGHEIIDLLFEYHSVSLPGPMLKCTEFCLQNILPLYCRLVTNWILHAEVHEYAGKWLVEEVATAQKEDWMTRYQVNHIPSRFKFFGDVTVANKILELGRLIACLGGANWDGWDDISSGCEQIVATQLYDTNDDSLPSLILEMHTRAGKDVMNMLLTRDRMLLHLQTTGRIYLQLFEAFPYHLFKGVKCFSLNMESMLSSEQAATALVNAAKASGIIGESKEDEEDEMHALMDAIAPCGSTPRDSIRSNYITSVRPVYMAASGLAVCVLSRGSLNRYQSIFQMIWANQFAYHAINEARYEEKMLDRILGKCGVKDLTPIRRSWARILAHLQAVLYTLVFYGNKLCSELNDRVILRVGASLDVAEAIRHHEEYLKDMEDGLFLNQSSVSVPISVVFDNAISIVRHHERFVDDVNELMRDSSELMSDPSSSIDDTMAFVKQEKLLMREEKVREVANRYRTTMGNEYQKFKLAVTGLHRSLREYEDIEPMCGLRDNLVHH